MGKNMLTTQPQSLSLASKSTHLLSQKEFGGSVYYMPSLQCQSYISMRWNGLFLRRERHLRQCSWKMLLASPAAKVSQPVSCGGGMRNGHIEQLAFIPSHCFRPLFLALTSLLHQEASCHPSVCQTEGSPAVRGSLATSGLSLKKKLRQPGDLFGRQREDRKGKGVKGKISLQSSGTSQFLSLCTGGSMPHSKCTGLSSLLRLRGPVRGTVAWPLPTPGH